MRRDVSPFVSFRVGGGVLSRRLRVPGEDMNALSFPDFCAKCREGFDDDEVRVGIVVAGSAWHEGVAILEDGAELYRTATYHERCAPPPPFQSRGAS